MKINKNKFYIILKKILIPITLLVLIICYLGIYTGILDKISIYCNWKILLPLEMKSVYKKESEVAFRSDGDNYYIFKCKRNSEDSFFLDFPNDKKSYEEEYEKENLEAWLKEFDIPQDKYPPFNSNYIYKAVQKDSDWLFIIYAPEEQNLYVYEHRI